jgi:hypothetical protein
MKKNDFLRQVVSYEYPRHSWEKDNFVLQAEYRSLVKDVLDGLKGPDRIRLPEESLERKRFKIIVSNCVSGGTLL